jgi:hypothetical protein
MQTERGAASLRIELRDGGVQMLHGEDGTVLRSFPEVTEGTWDRVFDAIEGALLDGAYPFIERLIEMGEV